MNEMCFKHGSSLARRDAVLARQRIVLGLAALLTLAGCTTVGPDYHAPQTTVPEKWSQAQQTGVTNDALAETKKWWIAFNDPVLDGIIETAVASNPDLRIAEARIRQARAQHLQAKRDFGPTIDASGRYSRERISGNSVQSSGQALSGANLPLESNLYQAGFDAVWEIDLFGKKRRVAEAANAEVSASEEAWRDALVTLLGEVARNYIEVRGIQDRLEIASKNIQSQEDALGIARVRFSAGLTSELDVIQAETLIAEMRAELPALEARLQRSMHGLAILLGREPNFLKAELSAARSLAAKLPDVPAGMPSDLLRRRPDIRLAERRLAAATARIGVQTAELFPSFALNGSLGLSSASTSNWWDSGSRFWSFGPTVQWRVFDMGRIRAAIDVQTAIQEEALVEYEKAVLASLHDVEDALVDYAQEQIRFSALQQQVEASTRAVKISEDLHRSGLVDFLNVIDARRSLYGAEALLAESRQATSTNLVALYKALGGGWGAFAIPARERAVAQAKGEPTNF